MNVDAAESRRIQRRLRKEQAVSGDDHEIGRLLFQSIDCSGIFERRGLLDRHAVAHRALLDRARSDLLAAARRTVRLGVDGNDPVRRAQQRFERRHCELRRAGEDDGQGVLQSAFGAERALPGRSLRSFSSFLRMRVRLSSDR